MKLFKEYLINGFFIFVPLALVTFLIAKTIAFLKTLVNPLTNMLFPEYQFGADLISNLIIGGIFVIICVILGYFSNRPFLQKIIRFLEEKILGKIPGYTFFKGITHNIQSSTKSPDNFKPVIVFFDDNAQLGFKIEHIENGNAVIYLPGAPNPWSGSIVYVEPSRIKTLDVTVSDAIKHLKELGRNSNELYKSASTE